MPEMKRCACLAVAILALGAQDGRQPVVRLWDTGKTYTQKGPMGEAWKDRPRWKHVPYGARDYVPAGDLVVEGETYYLFLFTNKDDSVDLMAKIGDDRYKPNEIYKVHDTGLRNFGMGTMWVKILQNARDEIVVEHAGEGTRHGKPEPIVTRYRAVAGKPWLEVRPVERVNQQGMHGKSRICAFATKDGGDFILDAKRETFKEETNYPAPEGAIGIINFSRRFRDDHDFMWFVTYPPGAEKNALTYLGFHADPFWEDAKSDRPSVGAQYAYLGPGGVFIGVLNAADNWKREDVGREIKKDECYATRFTAPLPGVWKMAARLSGERPRYVQSRVSVAEAGKPFVFRSPERATLDYVMVYLWDRTRQTPKSAWTPMDVYRGTVEER